MKPWIKRTLAAVFGVSLLAGGLSACGHHGHGPFGGGPVSAEQAAEWRGKMVDRVAGKLALDAAQKAKLTVLADKLAAQRQALAPAGQDPRADLKALVAGEKFDRARAQALVQDKTAALQKGSPEVIAAMADFYDSLNPTQQAKVREFMDQRRGWRRG